MKFWKYASLGGLAFVLALVAMAPASLLLHLMPETGAIELQRPQGFLWHGNANLLINNQPLTPVRWTIDPFQWFTGRFGFKYQTDATGLKLRGTAATGFKGSIFRATGEISSEWLNERLEVYDIELSSPLKLTDIHLAYSPSKSVPVYEFEGSLEWEGGATEFALSGIPYIKTLPPMDAKLGIESGRMTAYVRDSRPDRHVFFRFQLEPGTGWAHAGVTGHLLNLLNWPYYNERDPSAIAIEVSEKLF